MTALLHRLRREQGFTLVEMMVVVTILGFLATVSATLVTILFTANLRSSQFGSQQTTIENTFGFFSSRLALVQYGKIGRPDPESATGALDPLSVAGDQILFESTFASGSSSENTCFRTMYLARLGEIRVASQPGSCSAASALAPVRGPNENLYGGDATKDFYLPDENLFDPAIDSAYPEVQTWCSANPGNANCTKIDDIDPWTLATGIRSYDVPASRIQEINNEGAGITNFPYPVLSDKNIIPAFAFFSRSGAAISFSGTGSWRPPLVAGAPQGDIGGGGNSSGAAEEIGSVSVQALVSAVDIDSGRNEAIQQRFYEQRYALQQLCSIFDQGGTFQSGDLEGPYGNPEIRDGAIEYQDFAPGAFPSDRKERTASVTLSGGVWSEVIRYTNSDVTGDMPPGRYLVVASVTASNILENNSATAVETSIIHEFGQSSSQTSAATSSSTWPLTVTGVIENLNPAADQVVLRARSKTNTSIPASASLPIRVDLYWMGPPLP